MSKRILSLLISFNLLLYAAATLGGMGTPAGTVMSNGGDAGTPGDGTDTEDFINDLNNNNFGGFSDWRLPTIKELSYIVDSGSYNPAIDTAYFPDTAASYYWSSATLVNCTNVTV